MCSTNTHRTLTPFVIVLRAILDGIPMVFAGQGLVRPGGIRSHAFYLGRPHDACYDAYVDTAAGLPAVIRASVRALGSVPCVRSPS